MNKEKLKTVGAVHTHTHTHTHTGNLKNKKGITLVALVVTIVILLILAGISIASLTGNGLFEKAKLAKEQQENAQIEEEETLADYESKLSEYVDGTRNANSNVYSTNETEIGTWIDGRPVYRKVYDNLAISTGTKDRAWIIIADVSGLSVNEIINASFIRDVGYTYLPLEFGITNGELEILTSNTVNRTIKKCIIVYTKTTDTATNN